MKAFFPHFTATVLATFAFMVIAGEPTMVYAQDAPGIHPAYGPWVVRVEVVETVHYGRGNDKDRVIAKAAGFFAEGCLLAPFDVVSLYETRQTWTEVKQKIEVYFAGQSKPREGRLRALGFDPLDLDLACIDVAPPTPDDRSVIFPLIIESDSSHLPYADAIPPSTESGTPLVNDRGRVAGILLWGAGNSALLIPASNISRFLREARKVPSAWPTLLFRP
jgi:hypothetical protein